MASTNDTKNSSKLIPQLITRVSQLSTQNHNLEEMIMKTTGEIKDAERILFLFKKKAAQKGVDNTIENRDPVKEHFFLSVLGSKMELGDKLGRVFTVRAEDLWQKSLSEKVEFQRYHEWIEKKLMSYREEDYVAKPRKSSIKRGGPNSKKEFLRKAKAKWKCPKQDCGFEGNPQDAEACLLCQTPIREDKRANWMCQNLSCGFHFNPLDEVLCLACGERSRDGFDNDGEEEEEEEEEEDAKKKSIATRGAAPSIAFELPTDNSRWQCKLCQFPLNIAGDTHCSACKQPGGNSNVPASHWACPACKFPMNIAADSACAACKKPKPASFAVASSSSSSSPAVASSSPAVASSSPLPVSDSHWMCMSCSFPMNIAADSACAACKKAKPASSAPAATKSKSIVANKKPTTRGGDNQGRGGGGGGANWACMSCGFPMNIDQDDACAACKKDRGASCEKKEDAAVAKVSDIAAHKAAEQEEEGEGEEEEDGEEHWKCQCGFPLNPVDEMSCAACDGPRE